MLIAAETVKEVESCLSHRGVEHIRKRLVPMVVHQVEALVKYYQVRIAIDEKATETASAAMMQEDGTQLVMNRETGMLRRVSVWADVSEENPAQVCSASFATLNHTCQQLTLGNLPCSFGVLWRI